MAFNTPRRGPALHEVSVYLKDGYTVHVGGVVCIDGVDGYAVPGAKRTGLIAAGVFDPKSGATLNQDAVSNSSADGDVRINLVCGLFDLQNGTSTDTVLQSDIGSLCYLLDEHTVSRLSTGASAAGRVMFVNGDGTVTVGIGLPQGNLD